MSKWINKSLFKDLQDAKKAEGEQSQKDYIRRSEVVWPTPDKGTETKAKVYKGRFLPNPSGKTKDDAFYVTYFYHMFQSGDKWFFDLCPKTYNMENFCPFCYASFKLYQSKVQEDKKLAQSLKRKTKHACNWYVISDPRDNEREPNDKQEGKVKIYEFPTKVESKLKLEITNTEDGWGHRIFDPGDEGVDFTLNVKSTKPDKDGRTFPDYADSQFARQPRALGTEKEVENIMAARHDLNEFVASFVRDEEDVINVLKNEGIWDYVADEYYKNKGFLKKSVADDIDEVFDDEELPPFDTDSTPPDEFSDEDLLKELSDM